MLVTPNVGEDKATHVGESRDFRTVVQGVESPQVTREGLHQITVLVGVIKGVTSAWNVEMQLDPTLNPFPEHVLVQTGQIFRSLVNV